MGRLIDADLLMKNYDLKNATKYGNKNSKQQAHSYSTLMMYEIADMIEDAPTAYDVDAVVKQIEEKAFPDLEEECSCNGEQLVWLSDVLEIVRRGGMNNG